MKWSLTQWLLYLFGGRTHRVESKPPTIESKIGTVFAQPPGYSQAIPFQSDLVKVKYHDCRVLADGFVLKALEENGQELVEEAERMWLAQYRPDGNIDSAGHLAWYDYSLH